MKNLDGYIARRYPIGGQSVIHLHDNHLKDRTEDQER